MRKKLPGLEFYSDWERKITEDQVRETSRILNSIRGVSYSRVVQTETKDIYHLKFAVKDYGNFYLMYSECDEDFAKEAKKKWNKILGYIALHPNVKYADIDFPLTEGSNPIIKAIIFDLASPRRRA